MLDDQRPGTVYWIDHYAVGTNNLDRWAEFHERVLGAKSAAGIRPNMKNVFQDFTGGRHGGFLQSATLPPSKGPGTGLPRYGFFIRPEDVETQLRHLDACGVAHTAPVHTSAEGEEGTAPFSRCITPRRSSGSR